jgi:chloride channel protein, CIC family
MTRQEFYRHVAVVPRALAPSRIRALVRFSELGLVIVAAIIGAISGLAVTAMRMTAQFLHEVVFSISSGEPLSSAPHIAREAAIAGPVIGGLIMGAILFAMARWRRGGIVDPIEANALHGGRMSLTDSLILVAQNLVSNGFGASVGLEAGYTQISAGIASRIGLALETRRNDLRTLVGCGAAAGIATAFNAPLTGAFYGFELIIGNYSIATLTPVIVAALSGTFVARFIVGNPFPIEIGDFGSLTGSDYVPAFVLGILCAGIGIAIMQGVTFVEMVARKTVKPAALRPVLGGLIVGGLATISPEVLSAGHGALHLHLQVETPAMILLLVLVLKAVASAVSIGSGFRGGLFFASLLLGTLAGKLFAVAAPHVFAGATLTPAVYAMIGMSSMAVAIIGGPLTMTFLALETTGDFPIAVLVLVGVVASSLTVRKTFGYSFATWRFHLRGESIRSAHDVGWIRNLTVGRLMRRDVRTARTDMTVAMFRRDFPLGSTQRAIVTDLEGRYAGIVLVPEAHGAALDGEASTISITSLMRYSDDLLMPQMNAKEAVAMFNATESEALAVVEDPKSRQVLGLLTESYTLRRYAEELDRRRREISGEV